MLGDTEKGRSKYFYLDIDNIDPILFSEIVSYLSEQAHDPKTEIVTKIYSSDFKKTYLSSENISKYNKINLEIIDLSGSKKFGKEAVDRLVSMDVMSDIIKNSPTDVSFASNDYDFYGTLLFLDRFFEDIDVRREFIYSKDKANLNISSSKITIKAMSTNDKKMDLESELGGHLRRLGLNFNGRNSTEIFVELHKNGVFVRDYIGNKSFTGFLKSLSEKAPCGSICMR